MVRGFSSLFFFPFSNFSYAKSHETRTRRISMYTSRKCTTRTDLDPTVSATLLFCPLFSHGTDANGIFSRNIEHHSSKTPSDNLTNLKGLFGVHCLRGSFFPFLLLRCCVSSPLVSFGLSETIIDHRNCYFAHSLFKSISLPCTHRNTRGNNTRGRVGYRSSGATWHENERRLDGARHVI